MGPNPGKSCTTDGPTCRGSGSETILNVEPNQIVQAWHCRSGLDFMDDAAYHFIVWSGDAVAFSERYHDTVDGVDFAFFSVFQILEHAGFEASVLSDQEWQKPERELLFEPSFVVEQVPNIFALNGGDVDACRDRNVDTLFE